MRILFIGTGEIGLPALRWLLHSGHELAGVVTQPDKPAGRRQELLSPPVKTLAHEHGIPVFQPAKIRRPDAVAQIQALRPEVIVVMAYGQILPRAVLDAASVACLNLHASLLPRHRGAAPIQAAIVAGDRETGITVMHMDEGLDTGDILLSRVIAIEPRETGGSLHDRLAELAPGALADALNLLREGNAPRTPQDHSRATYAPKLEREHGAIDWTAPGDTIERFVRAMNPWPAAFTLLPGRSPGSGGELKKLKVFASEFQSEVTAGGQPGEILLSGRVGILVTTGRGALRLREVQLEGKRRLSAGEFLLGNPLAPGTLLRSTASAAA